MRESFGGDDQWLSQHTQHWYVIHGRYGRCIDQERRSLESIQLDNKVKVVRWCHGTSLMWTKRVNACSYDCTANCQYRIKWRWPLALHVHTIHDDRCHLKWKNTETNVMFYITSLQLESSDVMMLWFYCRVEYTLVESWQQSALGYYTQWHGRYRSTMRMIEVNRIRSHLCCTVVSSCHGMWLM